MDALRRLPRYVGFALVAALGAVACDETTPPEPEPDVETLRLVFPTLNDTVFVDVGTGDVTSGPIAISANTNFTAQFLKADGTPETLVTATDFQLNVTPVATGVVSFTRSSAFAGTLNKVAAGSDNIDFALFHIGEQHNEFVRRVPITVN